MLKTDDGSNGFYRINGNMTQRVENWSTYNKTFNAENQLVSVTVNSQSTTFVSDGDGNLVKKVKPDSSKTIYVCGSFKTGELIGIQKVGGMP